MRLARPVSARSRAASSAVAPVSKRSGRTPGAVQPLGGRPGGAPLDEGDHVGGLAQHVQRGQLVGAGAGDHDVRLVPGRAERVGAPVDADEDRPLLLDEGLDAGELLLPVVASHDHDHGPVGHVGGGARHAPAVQQQVLLAAEELGAVVGEALELGTQSQPRGLQLVGDEGEVDLAPGGDLPVVGVQGALVHGPAHRP